MTEKMSDSVLYFKSTTEDKMSDYEVKFVVTGVCYPTQNMKSYDMTNRIPAQNMKSYGMTNRTSGSKIKHSNTQILKYSCTQNMKSYNV